MTIDQHGHVGPLGPNAPKVIPPERLAKVNAARQTWIRQLVDMSRRNNLLYFRDLKIGTLDLTGVPADMMQRVLQSGSRANGAVSVADLLPPERRAQGFAALGEISAGARSNFEERGLDTLFLALGLASWAAADGRRDAAAPVLLIPIQAAQPSGRNGPWFLLRAGDVKVNEVLVHALREEHGLDLDADALLEQVLGDNEGEAFDLSPVFAMLTEMAKRVPGFAIEPRWILGNFAFQKMSIVKDLQLGSDRAGSRPVAATAVGSVRMALPSDLVYRLVSPTRGRDAPGARDVCAGSGIRRRH